MGEKEVETFVLERRYTEFVGNVHQSFDIVPGYGAFEAGKGEWERERRRG
jgi:hypothetical protein